MVLLAVLAPEKEMADSQIFAGREKINWRIRNLSKKRIRFLKRANNQIEILKMIYYLFSIFKKKGLGLVFVKKHEFFENGIQEENCVM